ncbi:MAG TPA: ubiquinol-cytochrome c reductase iron-sulfur subunit [Kofleriaceae bacterium]
MGDDAPPPDRRKFLKLATCGIGGAVGLTAIVPALSLVVHPSRTQTVTTPRDPIDVGDVGVLGPQWRKLDVIAPEVRDAWVTARNVLLGAAWVRQANKTAKIEALSGVCPHLGCPVGWEAAKSQFLCPCHNSYFNPNGEVVGDGPAKRGLDPLPIEVKEGRLKLTWITYKLDTKSREPA